MALSFPAKIRNEREHYNTGSCFLNGVDLLMNLTGCFGFCHLKVLENGSGLLETKSVEAQVLAAIAVFYFPLY